MLRNVNFTAPIREPEAHPEARTFKEYSEDLEQILKDIREEITDADLDPGFKQAADAMEEAIPHGKIMESLEPMESGKEENLRNSSMKKAGDGGLITVTGPASKLLAEKFIVVLQKFINKEYWPDKNCRTDLGEYPGTWILNQSYRATYAKHFDEYLQGRYRDNIEELKSRIAIFEGKSYEKKPKNTKPKNIQSGNIDFEILLGQKELEKHDDAKSIENYHDEFISAAFNIQENLGKVADEDVGFVLALEALRKALIPAAHVEHEEPLTAGNFEKQRKEAMDGIGEDGAINVTGEASKLLAEKHIELLRRFIDKKFWPASTCRNDIGGVAALSIFKQGYATAYQKHYPEMKEILEDRIAETQRRVRNYSANTMGMKK